MDLTGARTGIAVIREGTAVKVERDPEGTGDDTWDEDTGSYTAPGGDRMTVFEGEGYVADVANGVLSDFARTRAGGSRVASLPWDAPVIQVNDVLTVVANPDPTLVGKVFRVTGVTQDTLHIERALILQPEFTGVREAWTETSA